MSYKLIIAEKPSVAGSIAKIVGANTPHRDGPCGYLEGRGYKVTWAFGHLVGLMTPSQMGLTKDNLPLFPEKWATKILGKKGKDGKEQPDPMVNKQMKQIDTLFKGASEIIVATDARREGELIFRYIYEHLGCTTPFSRLWISSLTDEAIRNGLNNLKDGHDYDNLSAAAHARSQADWLVGFNASMALTAYSGFKGIVSLGRVQTPTLGMICQRYEDNKSFVPVPYWVLEVNTEKNSMRFDVTSDKKYEDEKLADEDLLKTKRTCQLKVVSVEKKQQHTKPPLLHDLTSLQRAANGKFGLTADETLKMAQSLYEKKYLTYPRTGSRYIPADVFMEIPALIEKIKGYSPFSSAAACLTGKKLCRKSVNDSKVTDHHALLPTGVLPSDMTDKERKIYDLVCGRMLEAFGEDYVADVTNAIFTAGDVRYKAHGSTPIYMGWKAVFGHTSEESEKENEDEKDVTLPELKEGDLLPINDAQKVAKQTKPLPIYTDSSLLGEMETCGKRIDDEEAREAMKDVGIGTPATRAQTIEILIRRDYIYREKKKLIPTELGLSVWHIVKGRKISDVKTTGEWERDLGLVEAGKMPSGRFDSNIRQFVVDILQDLKENCTHLVHTESTEPVRKCPCCGKDMKNMKFSITCDDKNGGCGYKVPREVAGKKLSAKTLSALCGGKPSGMIKGFKSKSGKSFDANLVPDLQTKEIKFSFSEAPAVNTEELVCPLCGGPLKDSPALISCECGLQIWKSICGKTLTEKNIKTILSGKTAMLYGLVSKKTGKKFDAGVKLNKSEKKTELVFNK